MTQHLLQSSKSPKELVEEDSSFPGGGASSQLVLLSSPTRSLRRTIADLKILYSIIENILLKLANMFSYKKNEYISYNRNSVLNRLPFLNRLRTHVARFRFFRLIVISDECGLHVSGFGSSQSTRTWGTEKPKDIQGHEFHSKTKAVQ